MTKNETLVLGICGSVGVGKTLLIKRIQEILSERYSLATLSDGVFTVKDLNYVPPLNIGLADELDQLRLSGKINLALIERPSRYLIPVDATLYLIDANANELRLTLNADLFLVNKIDLATYRGVDLAKLQAKIAAKQRQATILMTDLKDNQGVQNVICWIEKTLTKLQKEAR
ncbi:MAG: hypothetical protein K2L20_04445 [Ligilactobacillus sp.]|nr:hypothetical protein [Ligilactobacillus sp.]